MDMDAAAPPDNTDCPGESYVEPGSKDIQVQLVISLGLGITAFLAFCVSLPALVHMVHLASDRQLTSPPLL